jgi:MFS transporter, DHA1 family, inner membrane transport protein
MADASAHLASAHDSYFCDLHCVAQSIHAIHTGYRSTVSFASTSKAQPIELMTDQNSPTPPANDASRLALWVLLTGNLIIGTGVLMPSGILNILASEFSVSLATAGYLALTGGIVVGIGAPLVAAFTSRIDRRKLLTFAILLYAAGHLASAFARDFTSLTVIRMVMMIGATIFTPQAAATTALLVPPERRSAAIAFIFIGWSCASVLGIPLGAYLSALVGWRSVFAGMGVICLATAILIWTTLRPGLFVAPLNLNAWKLAFGNPAILTVLLVTLLSMAGQFTVFTYMAPIIRQGFGSGPEQVSIAFAVAGIFGVIGNALASRIVSQFGTDKVIAIGLICLIVGLGVFAASFGLLASAMAGIAIWGLGSFSSNSLQQSRLVVLAPQLAAATVALNTSVVFMGQSLGAYAGGLFVDHGITSSIVWSACGFVSAALVVSLFASRLSAGNAAAR